MTTRPGGRSRRSCGRWNWCLGVLAVAAMSCGSAGQAGSRASGATPPKSGISSTPPTYSIVPWPAGLEDHPVAVATLVISRAELVLHIETISGFAEFEISKLACSSDDQDWSMDVVHIPGGTRPGDVVLSYKSRAWVDCVADSRLGRIGFGLGAPVSVPDLWSSRKPCGRGSPVWVGDSVKCDTTSQPEISSSNVMVVSGNIKIDRGA